MTLRPYRPANGTEGLLFEHQFCNRCINDRPTRQGNPDAGCEIWAMAHIFNADEPEYPPELVTDNATHGWCTAFSQDPDELPYDPSTPRPFPLPTEILSRILNPNDPPLD